MRSRSGLSLGWFAGAGRTEAEATDGGSRPTSAFNPAVIVPYGFGERNPDADNPTTMPLTTTLVGDLFADDKILNVAHAFQSATDWHLRRPDMDF